MGRRTRRNLALGAIAAGLLTGGFFVFHSRQLTWTWSMATAYASLVLLATSLVIGPMTVLRGKRSPANSALRRDTSIWAGLIALAHVVVGLNVHLPGRMREYFLYPPDEPHRIFLRHDIFGFANYTGAAATLLVAMLLTLSNDWSLRALGTPRWKSLQRWSYGLAVLVVLHGVTFQRVENRRWPWVLAFGAICAITAVEQWRGRTRVMKSRAELLEL